MIDHKLKCCYFQKTNIFCLLLVMNLTNSLVWMFVGSILIGVFMNGMNILAYRFSDLYLSKTLVYSAMLMASNMCILEVFMFYNHSGKFPLNVFLFFMLLSIGSVILLRQQIWIQDKDWLKRMISHHSTALTTSHNIEEKTENKNIKNLARQIIVTQEKEINLMKQYLNRGKT